MAALVDASKAKQESSAMTLNALIEQYNSIVQQIIEADGIMTPEIESQIADTEEAIGYKLDGYTGFINYCKGQVEYLNSEADQYTSRAKTLKAAIVVLRERMVFAVQATGETKIKTAKHSYSLRESESWRINEELFSNGDLDGLVSEGFAERSYAVDMKALKSKYANISDDERPEYIEVTTKTSITIR